MRIFVLGRVVFSYLLLEISMGEKMVLKDATFEFWMKKSLIFNGSGQLFFKENGKAKTCADGRKTETWLLTETLKINQTLDDVKMFIEIDSKMANCDNEDGICFRDGFEIFTYNGNGEPVIPFPFNGNSEEKGKNSIYFNNNFNFLGNITGNETSKERFIKMFTIQVKKFNDITFGIKSTGACGTLFRMKIFYYVCQQKYKNSILLPRTLSPPNGTKVIYGNCSTNSEKLTNTSDLRAYCHSHGTWFLEKNASCFCRKGYEPTKEGCQACKIDHYKENVCNNKCKKCPLYTSSGEQKTTCSCKEGYYQLKQDERNKKISRCYAPVEITSQPKIMAVKGELNMVNVSWIAPVNISFSGENLVYDVECYVCNKTCHCPKLNYDPGQKNIKNTFVIVSGLVIGNIYQFKISPRDILSSVIPKQFNKFILSEIYIAKSNNDEPMPQSSSNSNKYLIIIVSVGCLFLILIAVIFFIFIRRRKQKSDLFQALLRNGVELPTTGKKMYVDPSNYDKPEDAIVEFATEIDASLLYLEMLIGKGEFGEVYKGSMTGALGKKHPVAVKTLKKDTTPKSERDFLLEASVMGQFDCPNVLKLKGVVTKYRPWMIVMEFMSNGSLDNFLKANDGRLSHLELISMAKGVAVGMKYLTEMNFVHRDLAARNVLIDGNLVCKVSDFGLSRELEEKESSRGEYATTGGKIPIRWTAPEATKYRKFSSASDVWSFGILLWEIMSFAERPYWEWDNFKVMEEIDNGFRLPAPLNCPKGVHDLMMKCWKTERVERPSFTEINKILDGWIDKPKTMEGDIDLSYALRSWLESIKMAEYTEYFVAAGYQRPRELHSIKEGDLKEWGITLVGHRNKIMKGIKNLQAKKNGGKPPFKKQISLEV